MKDLPNGFTILTTYTFLLFHGQASAAVGLSSRATNASNLQFEITPKAASALKASLIESGVVALGIDNEETVLIVEHKGLASLNELVTIVPKDAALFVFFKLASKTDIGFCYVSPPSCKIKDRMLFAASRQTVISQVESLLSVTIKKKVILFDDLIIHLDHAFEIANL
jgi:twinfilin-like protein